MGTKLLSYAGSTPATTHTMNFTATAGKTILIFATAAATLTASATSASAGWVRDVYPSPGASAVAVFRLPGGSNAGGAMSFSVDLNGARTCAAVVVEGGYTGTPTYSSLITGNNPSGGFWGTGGHTFTGSATEESFACFAVSRSDASGPDLTAYDNSYVEVGDSGIADDGTTTEDSRVWVASKTNSSFTSNGVTATITGSPSWGSGQFTGFVNYAFSSNVSPTANAGTDQSVSAGATVTLNGSGSSDPDGTITTYTWSQIAGTAVTLSGTGSNRTFTAPGSAGTLTFQLIVTDNNGASSAADTVDIVVSAGNISPVANAGADQQAITGTVVTLDGSASSDADGTIVSYNWSQTAGPGVTLSGTGATRTFVAPAGGSTLTFSLTVTDNGGATSGADTVDIVTYANRIVLENSKTGLARASWFDGVGTAIPGFATSSFYAPGATVNFKINYNSAFTVDIHRLGYYSSGAGARLIQSGIAGTPTAQPAASTIANSNGATDCSGWSTNASWTVPANAVPGWYYALIRGQSATFGHILFLVTDTSAKAPILVVASDTTWMGAYNYYGTPGAETTGSSLYGTGGPLGTITARALAVSYNRPVLTLTGVPQTNFFNSEFPLIRFLERMGYDVGYCTLEQLESDTTILNGRTLLVTNGHNEYISPTVWDAFKNRLVQGTPWLNLCGNDFFWKVEWQGRVMWCKKDTMAGPSTHVAGTAFVVGEWQGTWQDTRWASRRVIADIVGDIFKVNGIRNDAIAIPFANKTSPVWRDCTAVQALTTGQSYSLGAGSLGMEWDAPATSSAIVTHAASDTTIAVTGAVSDANGEDYSSSGSIQHKLQFGKYLGGGKFFNASTTQWAWGLDDFHLRGTAIANQVAQQATLNIIADLSGDLPKTPGSFVTPTPKSLSDYGLVDNTTDKPYTMSDLEMTFYRTATGTSSGTLQELKRKYYTTALGLPIATAASPHELERRFYLNALVLTTGSLQDLKRKYFVQVTGRSDLSTTDLERLYYRNNT